MPATPEEIAAELRAQRTIDERHRERDERKGNMGKAA